MNAIERAHAGQQNLQRLRQLITEAPKPKPTPMEKAIALLVSNLNWALARQPTPRAHVVRWLS